MRAAILEGGKISVGDIAEPKPQAGQVVVRTERCALCASDAHFLCAGHKIVEMSQKYGGPYKTVDLGKPIVMGHEFVGEIVDYGAGSRRPLKIGTRVTSIPVMTKGGAIGIVGYGAGLPGGFGEYMLLDEDFLLEVPAGLDPDLAALIEPLAVGLEHARVGEPAPGDISLVLGCGAIGLGVIAGLRLRGVETIVAADFDPRRRALACAMGAAIAIDPRERSPYLPLPELNDRMIAVVYECVGKPGILGDIIGKIGFGGKIVVGGACMEPEEIFVAAAQAKRLKVNFACGEEPQDMEMAMRCIVEGTIDLQPWLGETIGLNSVSDALLALNDPASPVRTVVDPTRL